MSREHENAVLPESREYAPPQRVHYKGAGNDQALLDDPQQAFDAIETFARGGKGDASQIVHIARALTFELKQQVGSLMKPLAQRLSGDQLMQLGEITGVDLAVTVELALHARPALGADHLRRYMRDLGPARLAGIGDDARVFAEVRKMMPGALELPVLAHLPTEIHGKPHLVEWHLATTDKTVAAVQCAAPGTAALEATLDHLGSWAFQVNAVKYCFATAKVDLSPTAAW